MAIAAAGIAAAGSIVSGVNQANQMRYSARVADANAAMDRAAAQDALDRGAKEEQRQYRKTAQLLGAQRAAMAANGLEVDFGSAAAIQTDTKTIGWEDAATIRENATREAKGYEISAANNNDKAVASRAGAKAAIIGGVFDAGSTMLSGAAQSRRMKAGAGGGGSTNSYGISGDNLY